MSARKRGLPSAPRRSLLTGDYDALSLAARSEALAAARESASQQIADEIDQDSRLGAAPWRDPRRIADARVRALPEHDPRRLAYLRALREARGT